MGTTDLDIYLYGLGGDPVRAGSGASMIIDPPPPPPDPDPDPDPPPPDPDPDPPPPTDPDPGDGTTTTITLSTSAGNAAANRTALENAINNYATVIYTAGGALAPISSTVHRPPTAKCRILKAKSAGDGLRLMRQGSGGPGTGVPILRARGSAGANIAITAPINPGATTVSLASTSGLAVGDWLFLQSSNTHAKNGKTDEGWLRRIRTISGNTVGLGDESGAVKAIPSSALPMTAGLNASKITMAPQWTLDGGIYEKQAPEDDYFDVGIELLAVSKPTMLNRVEVRSVGASGIYISLCHDFHLNVYVHDLLDDQNGTGWRREANPTTTVSNPYTSNHRHYGYGITTANAVLGGYVTGQVAYTRHAYTTAEGSGNQRLHSGHNIDAGNPEDIIWEADINDCWSTNMAPHENGVNLIVRNCTIKNPGRYQNDGVTPDAKENPDWVHNRQRGMVLRNVTLTSDSGVPVFRSVGVSTYNRLVDALTLDTLLDNVRLSPAVNCKTGIDCLDPIRIGAGHLFINRAGNGVVTRTPEGRVLTSPGGIRFNNTGTEFIFTSGTSGTNIVATDVTNGRGVNNSGTNNTVTWGTVPEASGNG